MKNNSTEPQNFQQDEIDFKELFSVLNSSKNYIIAITLIVTLIATFYAFSQKPYYKANSIIKIGFYTDAQNNIEPIRSLNQVINNLTMRYIELPRLKKDMISLDSIEPVPIAKKEKEKENRSSYEGLQYIVLRATAESSDEAAKKIEIAQDYIINDHKIKLDNEITQILLLANEAKQKASYLQDSLELIKIKHSDKIIGIEQQLSKRYEELAFSQQDITTQQEYLALFNSQKDEIENVLSGTSSTASEESIFGDMQTGKELLELSDLASTINKGVLTLNNMNKNRTNIESAIDALEKLLFESENNIFLLEMDYERKAIESQLQEKLNEIKKLELIVKNENYTNTEVFKKIGVKKVNPRIIQIISIGAIAGLFLSILLAFFRNALSKEPE